MRRAGALLLAVVSACVPGTDYGGTGYRCEAEPVCPPGFRCVDGTCLDGEGTAGPDGGGGDGDGDDTMIEAGTAVMGCDEGPPTCPPDARPARQVTLAAFQIDVTEVTEEAYAACVAAGACTSPAEPAPAPDARAPVRGVTWQQAVDHCAWRGARLPTEAEWERAARGTDARPFPWGTEPPTCDRAAVAGCGDTPVEVGSLTGAAPGGAHNLIGNVSEWVADWYQADYYGRGIDVNPSGPDAGGERVVRGGSYLDDPASLSAWTRQHADPLHASPTIGFRCSRGTGTTSRTAAIPGT